MSGLTTHALDIATGRPAAGLVLEVWSREESGDRLLKTVSTNREGRTDTPLLSGEEMRAGPFRIVFKLGLYFAEHGQPVGVFDEVPVNFTIRRPAEHHHVPLLVAPGGYSTYRGS